MIVSSLSSMYPVKKFRTTSVQKKKSMMVSKILYQSQVSFVLFQ